VTASEWADSCVRCYDRHVIQDLAFFRKDGSGTVTMAKPRRGDELKLGDLTHEGFVTFL
jgi:hypothetical protein